MNGNLIIKNASELVTCSGFTAKKGEEMSDLKIIPDGAVVVNRVRRQKGKHEGFDADQLKTPPDCVVVGNVVSRGFDVVEDRKSVV